MMATQLNQLVGGQLGVGNLPWDPPISSSCVFLAMTFSPNCTQLSMTIYPFQIFNNNNNNNNNLKKSIPKLNALFHVHVI
jgi:hypothetical protein